jgi:hypothetical protein
MTCKAIDGHFAWHTRANVCVEHSIMSQPSGKSFKEEHSLGAHRFTFLKALVPDTHTVGCELQRLLVCSQKAG